MTKLLTKETNNTININLSQIKQKSGNILINQKLFCKYKNVKEIFDNEAKKHYGQVRIKKHIIELENININKLTSNEAKLLAKNIFKKYNIKNEFENNGNLITVTKSGIEESINKVFASKCQRLLLKEHLLIFSELKNIIEHARLVNQTRELKNRMDINLWNYYFNNINIKNRKYSLEFDVRSMNDGTNQYRVQRLEQKN